MHIGLRWGNAPGSPSAFLNRGKLSLLIWAVRHEAPFIRDVPTRLLYLGVSLGAMYIFVVEMFFGEPKRSSLLALISLFALIIPFLCLLALLLMRLLSIWDAIADRFLGSVELTGTISGKNVEPKSPDGYDIPSWYEYHVVVSGTKFRVSHRRLYDSVYDSVNEGDMVVLTVRGAGGSRTPACNGCPRSLLG